MTWVQAHESCSHKALSFPSFVAGRNDFTIGTVVAAVSCAWHDAARVMSLRC
jgi:hypothetical protein